MPSFCAVVGCSKRAERDEVRFFKISKALKNRGERLDALSKERRESWVRALKRGNLKRRECKIDNLAKIRDPSEMEMMTFAVSTRWHDITPPSLEGSFIWNE
ncbi:hypothetical protein NQ317_011258 [Molorchus minor]|uniref:THAP-type domain-containing protein n=1 Tax=Molorchus minor TaxID=1323400 RepID=A0ABQ9JL57_9CUCU|nr:hypothetical protein NQ317_011258 [Molorchus minor]